MVIWLLFLAIILWVNLPSIVQKCLTNKLINKDYHPSNGPLKMIEWFRLYPLKKLLLAFIWGFCAYQSVRGFRIVWIEKHQEVLWIELFFLCFTLLTAYKIWKYIKTPYHCAKFNTNVCLIAAIVSGVLAIISLILAITSRGGSDYDDSEENYDEAFEDDYAEEEFDD